MTFNPLSRRRHPRSWFSLLALALPTAALPVPAQPAPSPAAPCRIEVVEQGTSWPVPLVELRTTHHLRFVSDNAGVIALDAPELMGRETWFNVSGHGYEIPKDGFGFRGVKLTPAPGKTFKVEVTRTILARRLGRLTGGGLFAESQKTGRESHWPESGVFGCDSVQTAIHQGRIYWLWGDTTLAGYPLGIFDSSGATTPLNPLASFEPPLRLRFDLFRDPQGRPRGITKMPGAGPTWAAGLVSLPDRHGTPRLVCSYMKIRPPLEEYEWGLAVWNEQTEEFDRLRVVWVKSDSSPNRPLIPAGHPVFSREPNGRKWVLFGHPFPNLRCPATFEAWQDPSQWEPLTPPAHLTAADGSIIQPHDGVHSGSIAWNAYRKRWVTVFMQSFGKPSAFGELWFAEADAPAGPWGKAVKVLSHDNYTFYNPRLHPELTPPESPILLFEGTYTLQFANNPAPTPRHDYNQILYRLDLDDPRLDPARQPREPKPE